MVVAVWEVDPERVPVTAVMVCELTILGKPAELRMVKTKLPVVRVEGGATTLGTFI